jgi:hypothetical protein
LEYPALLHPSLLLFSFIIIIYKKWNIHIKLLFRSTLLLLRPLCCYQDYPFWQKCL